MDLDLDLDLELEFLVKDYLYKDKLARAGSMLSKSKNQTKPF